MRFIVAIFFVLLIVSHAATAQLRNAPLTPTGCLRFEMISPEITLTGTVQPHKGYEIRPGKNSDGTKRSVPATLMFLKPDKPVCAQITKGIRTVPPTILQEVDVMAEDARTRPNLRPWLGKRVVLTGKLQWRADVEDGQSDAFLVLTKPQVQAAP